MCQSPRPSRICPGDRFKEITGCGNVQANNAACLKCKGTEFDSEPLIVRNWTCKGCETVEQAAGNKVVQCKSCEGTEFTVEKKKRFPRNEFCREMDSKVPKIHADDPPWYSFREVMEHEMQQYIRHANVPRGIARNQALKENLFAIAVCVHNKISLCLMGPPGSSKTLSFSIAADTMRGSAQQVEKESKAGVPFFNRLTCINGWDVTYQCSENSTDTEVKSVFVKSIERQRNLTAQGKNATATVFFG